MVTVTYRDAHRGSQEAKVGDVLETHLVQTNKENKVVGGFVVQVNVVAK